jgi:hypothetical protein
MYNEREKKVITNNVPFEFPIKNKSINKMNKIRTLRDFPL